MSTVYYLITYNYIYILSNYILYSLWTKAALSFCAQKDLKQATHLSFYRRSMLDHLLNRSRLVCPSIRLSTDVLLFSYSCNQGEGRHVVRPGMNAIKNGADSTDFSNTSHVPCFILKSHSFSITCHNTLFLRGTGYLMVALGGTL